MFKKLIRYILFLFITFGIFSCAEDEECRKDRYVRLYSFFYTMNRNPETGIETPVKLYIDSITIKGMYVDSVLYDNIKKKDSVRLPLNKLATRSDFLFTANKIEDTISIYYQNFEEFLSFECGCLNTFSIDSIKFTDNYIDSIIISSPEVNITNAEHIKIYHTPK